MSRLVCKRPWALYWAAAKILLPCGLFPSKIFVYVCVQIMLKLWNCAHVWEWQQARESLTSLLAPFHSCWAQCCVLHCHCNVSHETLCCFGVCVQASAEKQNITSIHVATLHIPFLETEALAVSFLAASEPCDAIVHVERESVAVLLTYNISKPCLGHCVLTGDCLLILVVVFFVLCFFWNMH